MLGLALTYAYSGISISITYGEQKSRHPRIPRPSKRLPCRQPKPLRHLERRRHRQEYPARGGRRTDDGQPRRHTGRRWHFPCRTVFGRSGRKPRPGGQSSSQCTGRDGHRLCGGRECRHGGSRGECRLEQ